MAELFRLVNYCNLPWFICLCAFLLRWCCGAISGCLREPRAVGLWWKGVGQEPATRPVKLQYDWGNQPTTWKTHQKMIKTMTGYFSHNGPTKKMSVRSSRQLWLRGPMPCVDEDNWSYDMMKTLPLGRCFDTGFAMFLVDGFDVGWFMDEHGWTIYIHRYRWFMNGSWSWIP